jgi:glycosyltransferase involved in cell wall biosynthesis
MDYSSITVMIHTLNEEPNLARTLSALYWATDILLIDSGSTDRTVAIASSFDNVRVVHRPFDNFADHCNFGHSLIEREWTLSLDADYVTNELFGREIGALKPPDEAAGYSVSFKYLIYGHSLRGTLYPNRVVLYRTRRAKYYNQGHTQRILLEGNTLKLRSKINHDDRKSLSRWLSSQQRYADDEARYLLGKPLNELTARERLRLSSWASPMAVLFYTMFVKGCILDGWVGWIYVWQRVAAECMIALAVAERRASDRK